MGTTPAFTSASCGEVCGYFDRVMQLRLLSSAQVRFLPRHEYLPDGRLRSLATGEIHELKVRKRIVDATYADSRIPACSPPPFEVASDAHCIGPAELVSRDEPPEGYVIVGGGKTAMDTCQWLLSEGVDSERITWIRPRDMWLLNRVYFQGGQFVREVAEGTAQQMEAAAKCDTTQEFFEECAQTGVMLSLDPTATPTMMRGATSHELEIAPLRNVERVVRLGHVQRVERDRILLERGEIATSPGHLHIHCAASGVTTRPPRKIFAADRITLQAVRIVSPSFSAALIGFLEGSGRDDVENTSTRQFDRREMTVSVSTEWILQGFATAQPRSMVFRCTTWRPERDRSSSCATAGRAIAARGVINCGR